MTAKDIVLLPGWGFSGAVLEPLATWLGAAGFRVETIELPPAQTMDALVDALLARAPPRATWIGWSLGGMAAVMAASRAPSRVASVVAIGSNACFVRCPDWPKAMDRTAFDDFFARVERDAAAALSRFALLANRGNPDTTFVGRASARRPPSLAPDTLLPHLAILRDTDLRPCLPLAVPTLWLLAENDALVPADVAVDLARHDNRARVAVVRGASHVSLPRRPESLSPHLDEFLREHA